MAIEEIKDDDYAVQADTDANTIAFSGLMSLGGPKAYAPIADLMNDIANEEPDEMTLDLRKLEFLNSSGISMLSKFVLSLRKKKGVQLIVLGSDDMPWQGKSLKNLQKFLPSLKLEIE